MSQSTRPNIIYHELDFATNTKQKTLTIQKSTRLSGLLGHEQIEWAETGIHSSHYHLHAIDLRSLIEAPQEGANEQLNYINAEIPTLIISECCLIYLRPEAADAVVRYFSEALKPTTPRGLALYEPINPFDSFGKVMVSNLAARGIILQTLEKYSSLDAQMARLKAYGFSSGQRASDVNFLNNKWIGEDEKDRINRVEMLDEVEELTMLMKHYCVAWGWNDGNDPRIWDLWKTFQSQ
jgi:hypothetical protein